MWWSRKVEPALTVPQPRLMSLRGSCGGNVPGAMGMLITVTEKNSARRGVVRFETNRALTGMAHERFRSDVPVIGTRPPDELARRLFAHGGAATVHVHSNQILVELAPGGSTEGMAQIITDLFTHYTPGIVPSFAG